MFKSKTQFLLVAGLFLLAMALPVGAHANEITVKTVEVTKPNNPSVSIVPFSDAIYSSCSAVPAGTANIKNCQAVGGVGYNYRIGQLEVTVSQWVNFLNTVDPNGQNKYHLWDESERSSRWPK